MKIDACYNILGDIILTELNRIRRAKTHTSVRIQQPAKLREPRVDFGLLRCYSRCKLLEFSN